MLIPDPERGQPDPMLSGSGGVALRRGSAGGSSAAGLVARYGVAGRVPENALPAGEIQARLEGLVFRVMSIRRSLRPSAEALACFPAERVTGLIGELERVTRTSLELGYHLCVHAAEVLHAIRDADLRGFVLHLLEVYDRAGTQGCIRLMGQVSHTAEALRAERLGQSFAEGGGGARLLYRGTGGAAPQAPGRRRGVHGYRGHPSAGAPDPFSGPPGQLPALQGDDRPPVGPGLVWYLARAGGRAATALS